MSPFYLKFSEAWRKPITHPLTKTNKEIIEMHVPTNPSAGFYMGVNKHIFALHAIAPSSTFKGTCDQNQHILAIL